MKIAITADLQFDTYRSLSRLDPATGLTSRLQDCLDCFEWIVLSAAENDCAYLAVLGDVFNSRTAVDIAVIHKVVEAFAKAAAAFEEVRVVAGNHDSYLRNPSLNSIQALSGVAEVIDKPVIADRVAYVPWHDDPVEYDGYMKQVVKQEPEFLMTHLLLQGAVGEHVDVGVPVSTVYPDEFEAVFLGDVHAPVEVAPGVQYVGAPMAFNYGDASRRGYWILDTDTYEYWFVENEISPRFYVIRDVKQLRKLQDKIRSCDYVRLELPPEAVSADDLSDLRDMSRWVESTAPEMENIKPRLNVRSSDKHGEVLRQYVEFTETEMDRKRLVKQGQEILEAVQ
jgi:DNA repair exonuclease SbcCD nuclease subunit